MTLLRLLSVENKTSNCCAALLVGRYWDIVLSRQSQEWLRAIHDILVKLAFHLKDGDLQLQQCAVFALCSLAMLDGPAILLYDNWEALELLLGATRSQDRFMRYHATLAICQLIGKVKIEQSADPNVLVMAILQRHFGQHLLAGQGALLRQRLQRQMAGQVQNRLSTCVQLMIQIITWGGIQMLLDLDGRVERELHTSIQQAMQDLRCSLRFPDVVSAAVDAVRESESATAKRNIALTLARYADREHMKRVFVDGHGLEVLLDIIDNSADHALFDQAAGALSCIARKAKAVEARPRAQSPGTTVSLASEPSLEGPSQSSPPCTGAAHLNNPASSDVAFLVQGQMFHAHRATLARASEVFASMLCGPYKETNDEVIHLPDVSYDMFEHMMRAIYTGALFSIAPEAAPELLVVSDLYHVDTLKARCDAIMAQHVTPVNLAAMFQAAVDTNAQRLMSTCALFALDRRVVRLFDQQEYRALLRRMCSAIHTTLTTQLSA